MTTMAGTETKATRESFQDWRKRKMSVPAACTKFRRKKFTLSETWWCVVCVWCVFVWLVGGLWC